MPQKQVPSDAMIVTQHLKCWVNLLTDPLTNPFLSQFCAADRPVYPFVSGLSDRMLGFVHDIRGRRTWMRNGPSSWMRAESSIETARPTSAEETQRAEPSAQPGEAKGPAFC